MTLIRRAIFTASLVAIGAPPWACGSDQADSDTLTAPAFKEQVNALCVTEGQQIGEIIGPLFAGGEPTPDQSQAALDQVVALSRDLADGISALAPPSSLAGDVDQLVVALDTATDEAAKQSGAEFFASEDDPWAAAGAMARDLGLDACGPSSE
jgi:hypothetical protein